MQNWIVQMVALVVAGVVIVIVSAVHLRVQRSSIAATQYHAAKTSETDLVGVMDRDFRNIGSTYPNYSLDPNLAITAFDSAGGHFAFWAQTERGMPPDSVRYDWTQSGTARVDTGYVPAYSVVRTVNGKPAGRSTGSVTRFHLRLLDNEGKPIATLSDTRQIEVDLSLASSLGSSDLVKTNDWQVVIRPNALAR